MMSELLDLTFVLNIWGLIMIDNILTRVKLTFFEELLSTLRFIILFYL